MPKRKHEDEESEKNKKVKKNEIRKAIYAKYIDKKAKSMGLDENKDIPFCGVGYDLKYEKNRFRCEKSKGKVESKRTSSQENYPFLYHDLQVSSMPILKLLSRKYIKGNDQVKKYLKYNYDFIENIEKEKKTNKISEEDRNIIRNQIWMAILLKNNIDTKSEEFKKYSVLGKK